MLSQTEPYKQILILAPFFSGIIGAALVRENLIAPKSIDFNENRLFCDFTNAANLADADRLMMPMVRDMVRQAEEWDMTGITRMFNRPHISYAMKHGVAARSFLEISEILQPRKSADILPFIRPRQKSLKPM